VSDNGSYIRALDHRLWKTADGKTVKWKDMDIEHLSNCYHMLRRKAEDAMLNTVVEYAINPELQRRARKVDLPPAIERMSAAAATGAAEFKSYIEYRVKQQEVKR